jgi:hypothetical protein
LADLSVQAAEVLETVLDRAGVDGVEVDERPPMAGVR